MNTNPSYYVAETYDSKQYTASIVRLDNEAILKAEGFSPLKFRLIKNGSLLVKTGRFIHTLQLAFSAKRNSIVVFHFPLLATAYKWLLKILNRRGVTTVALIIDLDGIRDKDEELFKKETALLQQFSCVIAHNAAMKEKLQHFLPGATIYPIEIFDYPFTGKTIERHLSNVICFAGNIEKSSFVYQLHHLQHCQFNVYGLGYDAAYNSNHAFTFKGLENPGLLPSVIEGSFGLVWDGDSIEECNDYLHYNNPHKLSLYLVAGLPVIVWKQSAEADFVVENKVGFTVDSLQEIPALLSGITAEDYNKLLQQVSIVGNNISKGYYLKKVIRKIQSL